jgi:hypothetical protein
VFEIVGGIFLFILAWIALQAIFAAIAFVYHSISDWAYSPARHSAELARRESESSKPSPDC